MTELQNMFGLFGGLAMFLGPAIAFMVFSGPNGSKTQSATARPSAGGDHTSIGSFTDSTATSTTGCDMHHSC